MNTDITVLFQKIFKNKRRNFYDVVEYVGMNIQTYNKGR